MSAVFTIIDAIRIAINIASISVHCFSPFALFSPLSSFFPSARYALLPPDAPPRPLGSAFSTSRAAPRASRSRAFSVLSSAFIEALAYARVFMMVADIDDIFDITLIFSALVAELLMIFSTYNSRLPCCLPSALADKVHHYWLRADFHQLFSLRRRCPR